MRIEFVDEDGSIPLQRRLPTEHFPLLLSKKKVDRRLCPGVWCWAETLYWNVAVRPSLQKK